MFHRIQEKVTTGHPASLLVLSSSICNPAVRGIVIKQKPCHVENPPIASPLPFFLKVNTKMYTEAWDGQYNFSLHHLYLLLSPFCPLLWRLFLIERMPPNPDILYVLFLCFGCSSPRESQHYLFTSFFDKILPSQMNSFITLHNILINSDFSKHYFSSCPRSIIFVNFYVVQIFILFNVGLFPQKSRGGILCVSQH